MSEKMINYKIPKIIHYFWFGKKELPEIFYKCIESWKKYCPDYEIKLWTEENFDVNIAPYCKQAYEKQKYAYVSDYARLYTLYNYGGIYLDIDAEILKSLDTLLTNECFMGFEDRGQVAPGLIIGSTKNNETIEEILNIYDRFERFPSKKHDICVITTNYLIKNKKLQIDDKIQKLEGITIYPKEYFCACDWITKETNITESTYCVHHYIGSWMNKKEKIKNVVRKETYKILGKDRYNKYRAKIKNNLNSLT